MNFIKNNYIYIPFIIGIFTAALLYKNFNYDISRIQETYRQIEHDKAILVANNYEEIMQDIFIGLRTLSRLPGIKGLTPNQTKLEANAHITVQELYNSLASIIELKQ